MSSSQFVNYVSQIKTRNRSILLAKIVCISSQMLCSCPRERFTRKILGHNFKRRFVYCLTSYARWPS